MIKLHHVQVACPRGGEDVARRFYAEGLGLVEVEKPEDLRAKGGVWFRSFRADGLVTAEVHVGVEEPFAPARKAHPALQLSDVDELEEVAERLGRLGFVTDWTQRHSFPGNERCHTADGHGNRVELLAPVAEASPLRSGSLTTSSSRDWGHPAVATGDHRSARARSGPGTGPN